MILLKSSIMFSDKMIELHVRLDINENYLFVSTFVHLQFCIYCIPAESMVLNILEDLFISPERLRPTDHISDCSFFSLSHVGIC